jgi:hypothetical protein
MKNKMTQATKYGIRLSTRFGLRRTVTDAGGMRTGGGDKVDEGRPTVRKRRSAGGTVVRPGEGGHSSEDVVFVHSSMGGQPKGIVKGGEAEINAPAGPKPWMLLRVP